jgi:hypothetical protein
MTSKDYFIPAETWSAAQGFQDGELELTMIWSYCRVPSVD